MPAFWDTRYDTEDFIFGTEPSQFIRAHARLIAPGQSALCVADGEGRNSVYLAEQGVKVTAWDGSAVGLEKARGLARARGVEVDFHHAQAEGYPWTARQYDAVVGIFIQFAGPGLRDEMLAGMIDATAPGGLILLHGYTPKQLEYRTGGPGKLENLYTEAFLRETFAGHEILELKSYETELNEGAGHAGMSALVDLVVRKV